ncbi:glycosyltransferase family 2 protein [Pontimicrobium sp. SW4]|uniref:Glycosyltransferase family 2 protein n=1 Tax=Pontimicrobium sp. SW4 TaxID=3153519 RepID=A0AAU7BUL4_9FLAO
MDTNVLISIIIPTYNRASVIKDTLNSLVLQTYTNWECLVVDDGSKDDSIKIIENYAIDDKRFKLLERPKNKPKGANACRNFGLEQAKGDFIGFFDSDDYMCPEYLELQLKNIQATKANYSICKSEWVTRSGKILDGFHGGILESNNRINDYISFKTFWPIHAVMYKSVFLKENELVFDESLQQSQEYDFHVKVMQVDPNYVILPKVLVRVIANEDSISYSKTNAFAKAYSSLRVRYHFLKNKNLKLNHATCVFLLHDIHRIFMQQSMEKNRKASLYAAYYYLKAHFSRKDIFNKYFFKHLPSVLIVSIVYNVFNKGYVFIKKSNTFNYS